MSLEDALRENSEVVKEHNELLRQVLGNAAKAPKAAAAAAAASDDEEAEEKPAAKRGRPKAAAAKKSAATDDDDDEATAPAKSTKKAKALTTDDAVAAVKEYVNEIEVEVDDEGEPIDSPENNKLLKKRNARTAFVKKCLGNLGVKKTPDLVDPEDIGKLIDWIESKKGGVDPFADDED